MALLLAPRPCIETQRKQNTHSSRGGKQQTVATDTTRSKKKHGDFTRTLLLTAHNKHALSFLFLPCFITVFLSPLFATNIRTQNALAPSCVHNLRYVFTFLNQYLLPRFCYLYDNPSTFPRYKCNRACLPYNLSPDDNGIFSQDLCSLNNHSIAPQPRF